MHARLSFEQRWVGACRCDAALSERPLAVKVRAQQLAARRFELLGALQLGLAGGVFAEPVEVSGWLSLEPDPARLVLKLAGERLNADFVTPAEPSWFVLRASRLLGSVQEAEQCWRAELRFDYRREWRTLLKSLWTRSNLGL